MAALSHRAQLQQTVMRKKVVLLRVCINKKSGCIQSSSSIAATCYEKKKSPIAREDCLNLALRKKVVVFRNRAIQDPEEFF